MNPLALATLIPVRVAAVPAVKARVKRPTAVGVTLQVTVLDAVGRLEREVRRHQTEGDVTLDRVLVGHPYVDAFGLRVLQHAYAGAFTCNWGLAQG
jgi:hypothetical protein